MDTVTMTDVDRVIGAHRESVAVRPHHTLPI